MGLDGIVLAFARESRFVGEGQGQGLTAGDEGLREWVEMNRETVRHLTGEDFLALRLTGAGRAAAEAMEEFVRLGEEHVGREVVKGLGVLGDALGEVLEAARERGVRVLIDAESSVHQPAIDRLALVCMTGAC